MRSMQWLYFGKKRGKKRQHIGFFEAGNKKVDKFTPICYKPSEK